jgi:hypothetical protein
VSTVSTVSTVSASKVSRPNAAMYVFFTSDEVLVSEFDNNAFRHNHGQESDPEKATALIPCGNLGDAQNGARVDVSGQVERSDNTPGLDAGRDNPECSGDGDQDRDGKPTDVSPS